MSTIIKVRPIGEEIPNQRPDLSPSNSADFKSDGDGNGDCFGVFKSRTRFLVMALVLLCLASVWSNILAFNFALICFMNTEVDDAALNETTTDGATQFTTNERSYLTASVAASALVTNFVSVQLVNRFGIRTIFTILGFLSAVATLFLPTAIYSGFGFTLIARILQGAAFSANFPVIGAFAGRWTYYKQNGLFVSALVAYVQLSPALTMPISGALCESPWGWPSVFYAHGGATIVLFVLFASFYRNNPGKHPFIGGVELAKISIGKTALNKDELRRIPYAAILKTASVWAVWLAALGNFMTVNMMFLYSPTYMNRVLHFPVHSSGISSALAPFAQFSLKLFAGFTSDKLRFVSETNKLRIYNSIAFFGSALFLLILAFFPTEYAFICLMIFGVSAGTLGFTTGGFFKAAPMVSKHYNHFVTGNLSLGITITMLVIPFIVNGLAPDATAEQWRYVFIFIAGFLILTNLLFVFMCSAEPAVWTTDDFSRAASGNNRSVSSLHNLH